jgi:plasmid stabilization system protein ParE
MLYGMPTHGDVIDDLRKANRWYETQRPGLGGKFLTALKATFRRIASNPQVFGYSIAPYRVGIVDKFPFVIHYEILASGQPRIVAVIHSARDDSLWLQRI